MKKIVLLTDDVEKYKSLVKNCKNLFPECDVIVASDLRKSGCLSREEDIKKNNQLKI